MAAEGDWRPTEKPPCRISGIGYLSLDVTDLPRSRDFYTRVVNLVVTEEDRNTVYLRCQSEHHAVVLHAAAQARVRCMAYETQDDAETEALRRHLADRGVTVRDAAPEAGCVGSAFEYQDPEGHWFHVYRAQLRRAPIISQAAVPVLRLGHFTLRCRDVAAEARFHREAVGFRVSDFAAHRGLFMRCKNPDHHSLAFVEQRTTMFHHMAFDAGSWEGIKRGLDWLARQQWAVEDGPVRHPEGNNIAMYFGDPDGFHIEFYTEMEQIADDEDHFRPDYIPFRNLWRRVGSPEGYHEMIPRDEHGKFVRSASTAAEAH